MQINHVFVENSSQVERWGQEFNLFWTKEKFKSSKGIWNQIDSEVVILMVQSLPIIFDEASKESQSKEDFDSQ